MQGGTSLSAISGGRQKVDFVIVLSLCSMPGKALTITVVSSAGSEFWVNTHIIEASNSQISCEGCYFGSKTQVGESVRAGAEIAISENGTSTVIIYHCRFERMSYTALRVSDWSSVSISHSIFDKNGSVLALGESGAAKIRRSSLSRSRYGTFYVCFGGTTRSCLDIDEESVNRCCVAISM